MIKTETKKAQAGTMQQQVDSDRKMGNLDKCSQSSYRGGIGAELSPQESCETGVRREYPEQQVSRQKHWPERLRTKAGQPKSSCRCSWVKVMGSETRGAPITSLAPFDFPWFLHV